VLDLDRIASSARPEAPDAPLGQLSDPIAALMVVVSAAVYGLRGLEVELMRDSALFAYGAQQVLAGVPPYVSVFTRTGPLGHLLPVPGALIARYLGWDELILMRSVFLLLSCLTVAALYLLASTVFRWRRLGVVTAAAFLTFDTFAYLATGGPREKTAMVLFVVLALLSSVRGRWFAAGIAGALAALTWQPAGLVCVAIAVAAVLRGKTPHRVPLLLVCVGASVPVLAIVLYFAAERALPALADGFALAHIRYTRPSTISLLDRLTRPITAVIEGYPASMWIIGLGFVGMIGLIGRRVWHSGSIRHKLDDPRLVVHLSFVLLLAWSLFDFQGPPDLLPLLPFVALGFGFVIGEVEQRVPRRYASALVGVAVLAMAVIAVQSAVTGQNSRLRDQQDEVVELLGRLPANAELVSMGAPQPLVLSAEANRTRYLIVTRGLDRYIEDKWIGGAAGLLSELEHDPPEVIAFSGGAWNLRSSRRWLGQHYVEYAGGQGWRWMIHESLVNDLRKSSGSSLRRSAADTHEVRMNT
jgi:hypothetical protein